MLERLYAYMIGHAGVRFIPMEEIAPRFRAPLAAQEVAAMCGLCGMFEDGRRWLDAATTLDPAAFRRERLRRVAIVRRVLAPHRVSRRRLGGRELPACAGRPARSRSSTTCSISGARPRRSCGRRLDPLATDDAACGLTDGPPAAARAHRLSRQRQDHAAQPAAARPRLADSAVLDQRDRRGGDRPSSGRAHGARRRPRRHGAAGGCTCCAVRGDLVAALRELHRAARGGKRAGVSRASCWRPPASPTRRRCCSRSPAIRCCATSSRPGGGRNGRRAACPRAMLARFAEFAQAGRARRPAGHHQDGPRRRAEHASTTAAALRRVNPTRRHLRRACARPTCKVACSMAHRRNPGVAAAAAMLTARQLRRRGVDDRPRPTAPTSRP